MHRLWPSPSETDLSDEQLLDCYQRADRDRPWLRVNFVTSTDGAVSVAGYSAGLSGTADKQVFGLLRMLCDAVMVGAGTLRHEGYGAMRLGRRRRAWRREAGLAEHPPLVLVSSRLDLDPASPMFVEAPTRPIVVTHGGAPIEQRRVLEEQADVLVCGDAEVDLPAALAALAERGLTQVLCEGGPHLLGSLSAADAVDELCLTVSPLLAGPGASRITAGPPAPVRQLRLAQVLSADDNLILRYIRQEA
ncbi:MAG: pyrimidine reductase family protein [Actinocatenispora sp.]